MFALSTAAWIRIALLAPFWWGMGLMVLALLGDVSPWCGARVSRLFDLLQGTRAKAARPQQSAA